MSKGFTLIETLLALCIISLTTLLLIPILHVAKSLTYPLAHTEDVLGVMRIRYMLSQSSRKQIEGGNFSYRYHGEDWILTFHHQNIVKEPGYEILLMHIKEANFFEKDSCTYLSFIKEEGTQEREVLLTCE